MNFYTAISVSHWTFYVPENNLGNHELQSVRFQTGSDINSILWLVHLDVLSLRPQTNTTSASAAARLATRR